MCTNTKVWKMNKFHQFVVYLILNEVFLSLGWSTRWSIWVWRKTSEWGVLATPTAGSSGSSSTGIKLFLCRRGSRCTVWLGYERYVSFSLLLVSCASNRSHTTSAAYRHSTSTGTPSWPKNPGQHGGETRNKASFISYGLSTWTRISSSSAAPRSSSKPPSRYVSPLRLFRTVASSLCAFVHL